MKPSRSIALNPHGVSSIEIPRELRYRGLKGTVGEFKVLLNVSCIALAGGKSTRLGRNKLAEVVGGRILLHRVLDVLSALGREVIVVVSPSSALPDLSAYPGIKIENDIRPGQGLLGGIYTGLSASRSQYNFVVGADMPFLNLQLMQYMVKAAAGADLVAYREGDRFEPLHAVYSRACMDAMTGLMRRRSVRILEIADRVKMRYLTADEIAGRDPQRLSFFNINTEEDLSKARKIANNLNISAIRNPQS
jgi:molybdopterin-guanine dinucleotide biosynthesis protein A